MLAARTWLLLLWLSQASRVLVDWGLRIIAFLQLREVGGQERDAAWYLVTAVYFLPFVVLAPLHGSLSNALPKRWVLIGSALFCLASLVAFVPTNGPWIWCLGFVAVGSALYIPTRFALLPPAAHDSHLALGTVNGWMELGSSAAIVVGVILGLQVSGEFEPGVPLVVAVLVGLSAVCAVTALPVQFPSDVRRPEGPLEGLRDFFRDAVRIFRDGEARDSLLALSVLLGVSTAGSGAIFMLALDSDMAGHDSALYALLMVAVGLALGCALAALQGHPRRALGLVPLGVTGFVIAQTWAALTNVGGVAPAVPSFLLGMMGGLVMVPLRTTYLAAVPADARGNAMSVMNTVICVLTAGIAGVMIVLIKAGLLGTVYAQLWFLVAVALAGAVLAWWVLFPHAVELLTEWVLWPMYRVHSHGPGAERLPARGPLLLIANHSSYFDPFWVAKIVPRHVRPMMTSTFYDLPLIRWLMVHVVGAIRVPAASFRREAPELKEAVAVLRRGGCVLVFPEAILRRKEEVPLRQFGRGVWHILRELPETPVAVFWIEGGWGSYASYKGGPPMKGKHLDWWRRIDIAVTDPEPLDPAVLADQRTTRRHLMRVCLEARRFLGLEVPEAEKEPVEAGEEEPESA